MKNRTWALMFAGLFFAGTVQTATMLAASALTDSQQHLFYWPVIGWTLMTAAQFVGLLVFTVGYIDCRCEGEEG